MLVKVIGSNLGPIVPRALELYEYNVQLSEVRYGLLHGLEVTVRNAEHHAFKASYGTPTWYDAAPLSSYWQDQLATAKAKPGVAGKPGKVVAELTFGFWIELIKSHNHRSLCVNKKLHAAFPNAHRHRSVIHDRLKAIQLLRNRISHHEPVLTAGSVVYNGDGVLSPPQLLECVEWVCSEAAQMDKSKLPL